MVGRYIELPELEKYTTGGSQRYVQTILCSPTANTLLMGTIAYGSFTAYGASATFQSARIFHGADLRGLFNPADFDKIQQVNGPGYGLYAAVDANDTFREGDTVENTPYVVQNWTKNKTFMDVEDPFATWNGHVEQYVGSGLHGAWTRLINQNASSSYKNYGGSLLGPDLMHLKGVWGGGISWDEVPTFGHFQDGGEPYLLYVQHWNSTQKRLGLFLAGYGAIVYNQGANGPSSFFEFGGDGHRNGIKVGAIEAAQILGAGASPTVTAGVAAGASAVVRVTGTNLAGVITVTTGKGAAASGPLAVLAFRGTLSAAPQGCSLMPREANAAAAVTTIYTTAPSTSAWTVNVGRMPLTDATTYSWSYSCL